MKYIYLVVVLFLSQLSWGQEILSLDEAINRVIANNPSLKIQQQNLDIASNNISKANTGQAVQLDAVGLASYNNNYSNLDIRTFQQAPALEQINISEWGVQSLTANVGVEASYVLWDGGAGSYRYQLLEGLSEIEQAKQEVIINDLLNGVIDLYYEITKVSNQIEILNENVLVTEGRIAKLNDKRAFSKVSNLDILQAETSLNQDLSVIDNLQLVRANLQIDLKTLMNDSSENQYTYVNTVSTNNLATERDIQMAISQHNPELKLMRLGMSVTDIQLELEKASQNPTIVGFGNAGYFFQQNDVQQLASIQTLEATIGVNARYNLYDGGKRSIKIQNAQIAKEIEQNTISQREGILYMAAKKELQTIAYLRQQLSREESNIRTYQKNYDKVKDRFDLGKIPEITLREAQLALTNSKMITANFQVDIERAIQKLALISGKR